MNDTATTDYQATQLSSSLKDRLARHLIFSMMRKLQIGRIILQDADETFHFGPESRLKVRITVRDRSFYSRVLFAGSIGAGEAYIDRLWDVDDLTSLVRIMVLNMSLLDRMEKGFAWLLHPLRLASHRIKRNTRKKAKENIISHYDLGNELYSSFLDPTMMYSAAIYADNDSSLEKASINKLEIICNKLNLKKTDRVIEIGSGWGGFAIYAAKNYGCHVTTTTISEAQYSEAQKRIQAEGLEDRITLLNKDYRDLQGKYDKLVSIEMIEAVGYAYLADYFRKCGALLKHNGMMLIQAITIQDQKFSQYARSVDFIQRHIFPGGCLASNSKMLELISTTTDMVVRSIEDYGIHYARTLKDWRRRFNANFSSLHTHGFDERFRRLWEFYLCYCEGGFLEKSISVVQLAATKPGCRQEIGRPC